MGDGWFYILSIAGVGLLLVAALAKAVDIVMAIIYPVGSNDSPPVAATERIPPVVPHARAGCPLCGLPSDVFRRSGGMLVCRPCALSGGRFGEVDTVTGQSTDW